MVMNYEERLRYRTQKARGLAELCALVEGVRQWPTGSLGAIHSAHVWPHEFYRTLPAFARPCPTVPRHGFVESRPVRYLNDALHVIAETLAADPNGEVIFMPLIPATVSGIVTNGGLVIGPKNDGATAGYGSYTIPSPKSAASWRELWRPHGYHSQDSAVDWSIKDTPYLEWVSNEANKVQIVQCRDGPATPACDNYIPDDVTVQEVIPAIGDLLEWEATVARLVGRKGIAVYHPGGSLSSHYAVHCMIHRIPVFITIEPEVGGAYKAESEAPVWAKADYKRMADSLHLATGLRCDNSRDQAQLAVAVMHAGAGWAPKGHLMDLKAVGAVYAARYITAACAGEGRHFWSCGPGRFDPSINKYHIDDEGNRSMIEGAPSSEKPSKHYGDRHYKNYTEDHEPWKSHLGCLLATNNRHTVYEQAFDWPWNKLASRLAALASDFDGEWRGGYGGRKWANVARAGLELITAINAYVAHPTAAAANNVTSTWNIAINTVHNGGKIMTKWVREYHMDSMALTPALGLTSEAVYRVCRSSVWTDLKDGLRTTI